MRVGDVDQNPYWLFGQGTRSMVERLALWAPVLDDVLDHGLASATVGDKVAAAREGMAAYHLKQLKEYVAATMPFAHEWGGEDVEEQRARARVCQQKILGFTSLDEFKTSKSWPDHAFSFRTRDGQRIPADKRTWGARTLTLPPI